jgi:hypothetical protein
VKAFAAVATAVLVVIAVGIGLVSGPSYPVGKSHGHQPSLLMKRLWNISQEAASGNGDPNAEMRRVVGPVAYDRTDSLLGGGPMHDASPIYLLEIDGHFVCNGCSGPEGSSSPRGHAIDVLLSTGTLEGLGFGIDPRWFSLASLGRPFDPPPPPSGARLWAVPPATRHRTSTSTVFGRGFSGPDAIAADGAHVWVSNGLGNSVTELSAKTGQLVRAISGSSYKFNDPDAVVSDATDVWVANYDGHSVTELSATTGDLVKVISGSSFKFEYPFAVASDGSHVWVANYYGHSVTELSEKTGRLVKVISGSSYKFHGPHGITSDGTDVWVTNFSDVVTELSAKTGGLVKVISGSSYKFGDPAGVSWRGAFVWVANYAGNSVAELSAKTGGLVRVISGP